MSIPAPKAVIDMLSKFEQSRMSRNDELILSDWPNFVNIHNICDMYSPVIFIATIDSSKVIKNLLENNFELTFDEDNTDDDSCIYYIAKKEYRYTDKLTGSETPRIDFWDSHTTLSGVCRCFGTDFVDKYYNLNQEIDKFVEENEDAVYEPIVFMRTPKDI